MVAESSILSKRNIVLVVNMILVSNDGSTTFTLRLNNDLAKYKKYCRTLEQ